MRARRFSLAVAAGASALALAGLLAGGAGGAWALALAAVTLPVALMALGAAQRGRSGTGTAAVLGSLAVCLLGSFAVLMLLRGEPEAVPASLLVLFAGVWLLPLVIVGFGYALTYRQHGVSEEVLARLAAMRRPEAEATTPAPPEAAP